jgi:hypothetical protein
MAKRFFASEIWEEDWFLDMPNEYRWFWFYMLAKCDHAGVFRVNPRSIRGKIEAEVTPSRALTLINVDKQRIRVLKDSVWLIEDFFVFQYGPKFNINNKVHESIAKVYAKHDVDINSIRGLIEVNLTSKRRQLDPNHGAKDKDKDKGESESREEKGVKGEERGWRQMPGDEQRNLVLPADKAKSALELLVMAGQAATSEHVEKLWWVFKNQHFDGKKFYQSESEVFKHFVNWSKTQKINGTQSNGNHAGTKLGTSEGRTKKAREWGSDFISPST